MADLARLIQVIEPEAVALGFDLVRVKLTGSGDERTLQIMAEDPATGQLLVDQCMALSRAISAQIDALEEDGEELIAGAYNLEVSSPGIDRPLTRAQDYAKWAGHKARINLLEPFNGKKQIVTDLTGLETQDGVECIGAMNKAGEVSYIPYSQIHAAQLLLTDKLIAATRPLDTAGVEDIEESHDDFADDFLIDDLEEEAQD